MEAKERSWAKFVSHVSNTGEVWKKVNSLRGISIAAQLDPLITANAQAEEIENRSKLTNLSRDGQLTLEEMEDDRNDMNMKLKAPYP
jgi:hypothetical protein